MAGPTSYLIPKALLECWTIPLERIGCEVERISDQANVRRWCVQRRGAKVLMGCRGDDFVLVFSSLLSRKGKNFALAAEIERGLLASGAKVYGNPISSNWVYRMNETPTGAWLKGLDPAIKVNVADDQAQYLSGQLTTDKHSVGFWTGPAVDSSTNKPVHYVALDTLTGRDLSPLVDSIGAALRRKGALRLEVQAT